MNYHIDTLRSDDFKKMILALLKNPKLNVANKQTDRGVGVNIIGYMMMFLLMLSCAHLFAFADDKEQGQLRRIAASPTSFGWYLAAHLAYCLTMLLPAYIMLAVLKLCGWDIGFSLLQYAGLMLLLSFLGISFALLLHTLIKKPDSANMLGNSITILTTVLAGSFYSFSKNGGVMDNVIKLLPQKEIMDFAQHVQNGSWQQNFGSVAYVLILSLAMFVFSCTTLHNAYVKKV